MYIGNHMSQIKIDDRTRNILSGWIHRAMEAEREAGHARETVASILQIIAPGIDPDRIHLDARTMTVTVLPPEDGDSRPA